MNTIAAIRFLSVLALVAGVAAPAGADVPPTATTNPAIDISASGATLSGTVNANGFSTTVTFEYGLDTSYGNTITADQSPVVGSLDTAVSATLVDLQPDTPYHYRVVAENASGVTHGADMTFVTLLPQAACCHPSGTCWGVTDESGCDALGGEYQGDDTVCETIDCPVLPGACCLAAGACQDVADEAECDALGGVFQGHGTECTATHCPMPVLAISADHLNFGAVVGGASTSPQSFLVTNTGTGTLNWEASFTADWLTVSPLVGTGPNTILASVDPLGLPPDTYTHTITVIDSDLPTETRTLDIRLEVYPTHAVQPPFGVFETPVDGSTVSGSIPVTGWALDDIEVESVKIYCDDGSGSMILLRAAVFVEGARPDVEAAYPDYPRNYAAGWGCTLLTNTLPNGGDGDYVLYAKATDAEGDEVTLGSKSITVDNATAVKPFGAIDTPQQGGTASGSAYVNHAWALTPPPNMIPIDGSTITVWVDGVPLGNPVYNQYRPDIATLFPGYANSDGAGGYFYLDTTAHSNGVHTIQWTVQDDAGNQDGIGSRYFTVANRGPGVEPRKPDGGAPNSGGATSPLRGSETTFDFGDLDAIEFDISELFGASGGTYSGFTVKGDLVNRLPIGSTFDAVNGIHYWQPGPAFDGAVGMRYYHTAPDNQQTSVDLTFVVAPIERPTGACCLPAGCEELTEAHCTADGGVFVGDNTICSPADCNGNGVPDICDIATGASDDCDLNGIPDECEECGDLDNDDDVDYDDYVIFLDAFGGPVDGSPPQDECCDYDATGVVGMTDYDTWLSCYRTFINQPFAPPPSAPAHPEDWSRRLAPSRTWRVLCPDPVDVQGEPRASNKKPRLAPSDARVSSQEKQTADAGN